MSEKMENITEIIPDDIPGWAKKSMDEGQFFNKVCEMIKEFESILTDIVVAHEHSAVDWAAMKRAKEIIKDMS